MSTQYPDKRVRRTKDHFKRVLFSLMEKKNFCAITISEIVKEANFNRGTFYAHYERKEDLLNEMIEEVLKKATEAYRKPYLDQKVLDFNRLQPESIAFFDHFLEYKKFYQVMLGENSSYSFREKLIRHLEPLFRKDFDYSATIDDDNLDIHLFATYRIHGAIGLLLEWIENDFEQTPLYMSEQLLRIYRAYIPEIHVNNLVRKRANSQ
ncbi:TetR/AcrR family transcriptional regulator [Robertmurraya yapensis]|uniref:TetR/AcrR family transcriptional regulator n=2 Tax=Bacillaceae TaxID=186817 RepID=A0A3S0RSA5_9BACI|nr:TetR/AcrR family transcriptional regulator [Bacillus yapensis]RTR35141.1 TetR/AcrR family transcriptional regulator [Bacillus yapensis]TKS97650.1 TetR family transcriptional regulator [Bacillus yapensis]